MPTQVESGPPVSARPTGTVTFLFSDIEGSTVRWERSRDAMSAALVCHDAIMHAAIEAHGGYVFKTVGDAFCAAFAGASEALIAAVQAQRALALENFDAVDGLRVRMAIHCGAAAERNGDYFGPTVNRVARLLSIGHGGQILVSGACSELTKAELPPDCSLLDLGSHRLKDLAHPERVYQVVADHLPATFPPLLSLDNLSNNLPAQLTAFVGREDVVAEIKGLVEQHRLVTLVGTGGAGKTRCAIQVGAELIDGSGDGVWLVELAPITDPSLVPHAIARALGIKELAHHDMLETVVGYLKRKRLLLILDNCEHVIDAARQATASILQSCGDVRIIATSRERLNISGEHLFHMPSLSLPPQGSRLPVQELMRFGGPLLFADRAMSVDGAFKVTDDNVRYVTEICRRLDGIPLAIELAAARIKVLTPSQLAQRLDERFRVLTGGDRSALPRQQTMRALIDWSYDLLTEDERTLFRKLSVFAGSFSLESIVAVCGDGALDDMAILDLLSSLVDKSLVQADPAGHATRYRLLESTREYARERLAENGEYEGTARAHAFAYLALAEDCELDVKTPDSEWDAKALAEIDNWRTALEWSLNTGAEIETGQRLAGTLRRVWVYFAPAEGRHWVHIAKDVANSQTPDRVAGELDLADAMLHAMFVQYKASCVAAERALERFERIGDARLIALAQRVTGVAYLMLGRESEGEAIIKNALAIAERLDLAKLRASLLENLAWARQVAGDLPSARERYNEALAVARAGGFARAADAVAMNLAEVEFLSGNAEAALKFAGEALAGDRARNALVHVTILLYNMCAYSTALGRFEEARRYGREALALSRDAEADVPAAITLAHLAAVGALEEIGDPDRRRDVRRRAARVFGYADARMQALEAPREYTEQQEYDRVCAALSAEFAEVELDALTAEGSRWGAEEAMSAAQLL